MNYDIPIYFEIEVKSASAEVIRASFRKAPLGHAPIIVHLPDLSEEEMYKIIAIIDTIFDDAKISTKLPYPTYLITEQQLKVNRYTCFKKRYQVPRYFNIQSKQNLNTKEAEILDRVTLLSEKINSSNPTKQLMELSKLKDKNRKLFMITREAQFYIDLYQSLGYEYDEEDTN